MPTSDKVSPPHGRRMDEFGFAEMEVNEKRFIPEEEADMFKINSARQQAEAYLIGRKFMTRKMEGGRVIWRIK